MPKLKSAFTLIELLIVISVIGILVTVATASYSSAQEKSRDSRRKTELKEIRTALVVYYSDHGKWPGDTITQFYASDSSGDWIPGLSPDYFKYLPQDPRQSGAGDCTQSSTYCYQRLDNKFVLWAQLENEEDFDLYDNPDALCNNSPPETNLNFCVPSPEL